MDEAYDNYKKGYIPGYHLFGVTEMEKDYNVEVTILKHVKYPLLNRIGDWFDLGFLDQQLRALFALSNCDMLYSPAAAGNTKLLLMAKMIGLVRKPMVILVHQPLFGKPSQKKWKRMLVKRLIPFYDAMIFNSKKMMNDFIEAYDIDSDYANEHFYYAPLCIDHDYFGRFLTDNTPEAKEFIMSSGNTGRDFDLLLQAAERINFPFKIYCKPKSYPRSRRIPPNVEIFSGDFPFERICKDYANSRIIVIPLRPNPIGTVGFTSLSDALAFGKPVIMTKSENIDIEVESKKIGIQVEEGNVDAWVKAISELLTDYKRLKEMGDNSLREGRENFCSDVFSRVLATALQNTYQRACSNRKNLVLEQVKP